MSEPYQNDARAQALYTPMGNAQMVQVAIFGLIAGILVWGLSFVLETYVLKVLLCQTEDAIGCNTIQYGEVIATILVGAMSLFVLVRLQVFRPLLVVIAVLVSLWGLVDITSGLPVYLVGIIMAAMYALTYLVFTWLTRLRLFIAVVILLIILVAAIRLILSL